jgi:hypothetical protein
MSRVAAFAQRRRREKNVAQRVRACCRTCRSSVIPFFAKKGWLRHKERTPYLSWRRRGSSMKGVVKTNISPQTGRMGSLLS